MLSKNVYVHYQALSKEALNNFLWSKDLFSNQKNFEYKAKALIEYKDSVKRNYKKRENNKAYMNIYAHQLTFLIPYEVRSVNHFEFIKSYMLEISKTFNSLLWIARITKINKAIYADVTCFTRQVFQKEQTVTVVYNQDYYYSKKTGKRVNKNHPDAVLKAKKGDPKLDKNGEIQTKKVKVDSHEIGREIFIYKDGFNKMISFFKEKWLQARKKFTSNKLLTRISRLTYDNKFSIMIYKKLNSIINDVNHQIIFAQELMDMENKKNTQEFINEVVTKLDEEIHEKKNFQSEKLKEIIKRWWFSKFKEDFIC